MDWEPESVECEEGPAKVENDIIWSGAKGEKVPV